MKAKLYSKDFVVCPWCNKETDSVVSHLYDGKLPRSFGPWYCDTCGMPYRGTVLSPGDVEVECDDKARSKFVRSLVLLRLDTAKGLLFVVLDHRRYEPDDPEFDVQSNMRYLLEEHSCPINWLREAVMVTLNGDTDPHGFLDFVRCVDVPPDMDVDSHATNWEDIFPEIFDEAPMIDGEIASPQILLEGKKQ